jgi:hypothetical protein
VPQNSNIWVSGWAADKKIKGPATKVVVLIDGTPFSNANLGASRPDVAAALGSSSYTNTGWYLNTSIGSLATGTHSVTAVAYDSTNATTTVGAATITVTVPNTPPFGGLDSATGATTKTSTVPQGTSLVVSGWAADKEDGAPIGHVAILIDNNVIGNATLGGSRSDVAAYFNNSSYANSGYQMTYSIGSLAVGSHSVTAVAYDKTGASTTIGSLQISVSASAPTNTPPFGSLDWALGASTNSSTVPQGTNLVVSGWAADKEDGAPVGHVAILIDNVVIGNATLGGSRADVAGYFNNSSYTGSGYQLTYNIGSLASGAHTVTAVAYDSAGVSTVLGALPITVQ